MTSDLIDLPLALHHKTAKAALVSETGDAKKGKWLPLSKIEIHDEGKTVKGEEANGQIMDVPLVTVTMPEWLAIDKGLV